MPLHNKHIKVQTKTVKDRLPVLKQHYLQQLKFINEYGETYNLPKRIQEKNKRNYIEILAAIELLDQFL